MNTRKGKAVSEVRGEFITSQTAKGVSEITLRSYRQALPNITRFFDAETPMVELSKKGRDEHLKGSSRSDYCDSVFLSFSDLVSYSVGMLLSVQKHGSICLGYLALSRNHYCRKSNRKALL